MAFELNLKWLLKSTQQMAATVAFGDGSVTVSGGISS